MSASMQAVMPGLDAFLSQGAPDYGDSDLRDRCESALIAMTPAELAERVATVMDTETLFYILTGQTAGHDYLEAMDPDQLAKFAGVSR